MVTLIRKGLRTYYYGSKDDLKPLFSSLTHFMEGAQFSQKYRDGWWDGNIKYYDLRGGWFWYGLIDYVIAALKKRHIDYTLEGYDELDVSWVKFSSPFLESDRDYQRESIISFLQKSFGTIMVPTRGGKTFIASEIIRLLLNKHVEFPTMFIVDNTDLFNQAIDDISKVTGIPKEHIGIIKEKTFDIKPITVAMIQTMQVALRGKVSANKKIVTKDDWKLAKDRKRDMERFLKTVKLLVIDEIQEYGSSNARLTALRKMENTQYILSISATPHKFSNQLHRFNVESISGGIVYEIEEKTLVSKKVLAENRMLMLIHEHDVKKWQLAQEFRELFNSVIIRNGRRNGVLLMLLSVCRKLGLKTLAMFNSIEHGEMISSLTGYGFLSGRDNEERRLQLKQEFLKSSGGVMLVSDIWKKGITLPSVEVFVNVDGGKESTLIIQRRGRVLGVTDTKRKALAIDFIDDFPKYFGEHTLERIKAYEEKLGQDNIDVLDTGDADFLNQLEDYLVNWFELNVQE